MFDFCSSTSSVLRADLDPLVVVVDGDRQDLLGLLLADHVLVEERVDLVRLGELVELQLGGLGELLLDDLVAEVDALVADVDAGAGDELLDLLLDLPQNEHFSRSESPNFAMPPCLPRSTSRPGARSRPARTGCESTTPSAAAAASSGVILAARDDLVDDPVLLGLLGRHDEVAVGVLARSSPSSGRCARRGSRPAAAGSGGSPWPGSRCRRPGPERRRAAGGSGRASAAARTACRGAPAASSTAAAEAAWPITIVDTSGLMYCMVS